MAVYCRQVAEGESDQTYQIAQHRPNQTDVELLTAKAKGAADKGWAVEWTGEQVFTAIKVRWTDVLCVRTFWID